MLIQKIQGGLGNQMFQYAFIKALSLRNKVDFKLDISEYKTYFRPYELEIFNINKNYADKSDLPFYEKNKYQWTIRGILSRFNKNHYKEREGYFESGLLHKTEGYFDGYFQSEEYFKDFESEIREDFTFVNKLSDKNLELLDSLDGNNIVSVHIRRGDFLKKTDFHPICSLDYYNKAIIYIYDKVKNPVFLFFSDDSERVKENIKGDNYHYINRNLGKDSWQDMALMSKCKHNIVANSSFSWWGAWLNSNPDKIILCPINLTKIYNEKYYPKGWIKIT